MKTGKLIDTGLFFKGNRVLIEIKKEPGARWRKTYLRRAFRVWVDRCLDARYPDRDTYLGKILP